MRESLFNSITDREVNIEHATITIGVLDISKEIHDDFLKEKMLQQTEFYLRRIVNSSQAVYLGTFQTVEEILQASLDYNFKYCLIATQGLLLFRGSPIISYLLDEAENRPEFLVTGHLLNKKETEYPGLHRQMLLVNVEKWKEFDYPSFGQKAFYIDDEKIFPKPDCYYQEAHTDYTPTEILRHNSRDYCFYKQMQDGWNWIKISLEHDLPVFNFGNQIRECKIFLYPYIQTADFSECWQHKDLKKISQLENYNQKMWLRKMTHYEKAERNRVYAFNTERLSTTCGRKSSKELDCFYSVAAGLKPIKLLQINGFSDQTRIVYFDWCEMSLNWRKKLLDWNGRNYDEFLRANEKDFVFASTYYKNYHSFWKHELDTEFENADIFYELWQEYRTLSHEFIKVDLFNDCETTLKHIQKNASGELGIWWSNIFSSELIHMNTDISFIKSCWQTWINGLHNIKSDMVVYGNDWQNISLESSLEDYLKNQNQSDA